MIGEAESVIEPLTTVIDEFGLEKESFIVLAEIVKSPEVPVPIPDVPVISKVAFIDVGPEIFADVGC